MRITIDTRNHSKRALGQDQGLVTTNSKLIVFGKNHFEKLIACTMFMVEYDHVRKHGGRHIPDKNNRIKKNKKPFSVLS